MKQETGSPYRLRSRMRVLRGTDVDPRTRQGGPAGSDRRDRRAPSGRREARHVLHASLEAPPGHERRIPRAPRPDGARRNAARFRDALRHRETRSAPLPADGEGEPARERPGVVAPAAAPRRCDILDQIYRLWFPSRMRTEKNVRRPVRTSPLFRAFAAALSPNVAPAQAPPPPYASDVGRAGPARRLPAGRRRLPGIAGGPAARRGEASRSICPTSPSAISSRRDGTRRGKSGAAPRRTWRCCASPRTSSSGSSGWTTSSPTPPTIRTSTTAISRTGSWPTA